MDKRKLQIFEVCVLNFVVLSLIESLKVIFKIFHNYYDMNPDHIEWALVWSHLVRCQVCI